MKSSQKGFVIPLLIAISIILVIGGSAYVRKNKKAEISAAPDTGTQQANIQTQSVGTETNTVKTNVTFSISGNDLSVVNNGKVVQTVSVGEDGIYALHVLSENTPPAFTKDSEHIYPAFIVDRDVNFDGHNDVGVLSGTGYAGVNYFYDFYIFDPINQKLEKSAVLSDLVLTNIDPIKKQIVSTYKSGPGYVTDIYQWNGSTFIKSSEVPEWEKL